MSDHKPVKTIYFKTTEGGSSGFFGLLGSFGLMMVLALFAWHHMESEGHHVTGMTNQVVWGLPHVFALFLIVAASGALNVASIASVFGKMGYKPLSRMSAVLAITLLAGGLAVLLLDLGRPDRLIVALTHYNFKSIFAWNILLYTGFFGIVLAYLWTMMDKSAARFSARVGLAAFLWRLALTTGTGSIFGFLVARQAYDAAIMAPMFVAMSFSFGLAVFLLVLLSSYEWTGRPLGDAIVTRLARLLGVFVAGVLYMVLTYHLTNLYGTENHALESFLLLGKNGGGLYAFLFWAVQIVAGSLVPLVLLLIPRFNRERRRVRLAAMLVVLGAFAQIYVILIGGQAYPIETFPGMDVSSSFFDGVSHAYTPSVWEILLGLGGVAIALGLFTFAAKALSILPVTLADDEVPAD